MYRHLIRLDIRQRLSKSFNCLPAIRRFSDDSKEDKSDENSGKGKNFTSDQVAVKNDNKNKKESLQTSKQADNKLDSLINNAKNIKSIGPKEKQTISQSIGKPKTFIRQSAKSKSETKNELNDETEPIQVLAHGLDKRLAEAARRVASKMPKHISKTTEKELLDLVQKQKIENSHAKKQFEATREIKEDYTQSISYQIMKESRQSKRNESSFDEFNDRIASTVEKIQLPQTPRSRSFNQKNVSFGSKFKKDTSLFSGECLNIFDPKGPYSNSDLNRNLFWEKLLREEVERSVDFPPENPFEELIKLTKEGKIWNYPINNEQGLEAEEEVPFYEHVLLDNLLEEFPDKGPVRQFMELVVIGLSQNPYITVERKHETIGFYKNFFEEKNLLDFDVAVNESSL